MVNNFHEKDSPLASIWERQVTSQPTDVTAALASQWTNPGDVLSILLIIGGDVVQRAFAQGSGKLYVPVCLSFGCVAYAFMGLINIIGDGRLLPQPDYGCKVFNLRSGYCRSNKNFVVGRLLRDMEAIELRRLKPDDRDYALKISVFKALYNRNGRSKFSWTYLHLVGVFVTAIQLGVSAIPYIVGKDWNVLLITLSGTFLVQWAGMLPQWTAEKLPNRQNSWSIMALTGGNGSREIMVIFGYGNCLDLESLATQQTPRNSRPWEKFRWLSRPSDATSHVTSIHHLRRHDSWQRQAVSSNFWPLRGFPLGFMITRITFGLLSIIWLVLLINVSAARNFPDSWCLLAIGGIGMFQNAWLAAMELPPPMRNLPLERIDQIITRKVMDGIMDFQYTYELGECLRDEFFPGKLTDDEEKWWNGDWDAYDNKRRKIPARGLPRRWNDEKKAKFVYPATNRSSSIYASSLQHVVSAPTIKRNDGFTTGEEPTDGSEGKQNMRYDKPEVVKHDLNSRDSGAGGSRSVRWSLGSDLQRNQADFARPQKTLSFESRPDATSVPPW